MYAAVYLPHFPLQAVTRLEPHLRESVIAVFDDTSTIIDATDAARATAIFPGISSSQALARNRHVILKATSPSAETSAQETLLGMTCQYSPYLENTAPGLVTIDLRFLKRASLQSWVPTLIEQLRAAGFDPRVGVAPNPILAFQAASSCDVWQVIAEPMEFLADLPIEILGLTPEVDDLLRDWGIRTLGQLQKLPRAALGERLGALGLNLWDQAAGKVERVLRLERPPEHFHEAVDLEYGVETLEPLLFLIRKTLDQLAVRVGAAWLFISELNLTLRLDNGESRTRSFRLPSPTRDVELLFRVLFTHLETEQAEAPLVGFVLQAVPSPAPKQQFGLFETALKDPNRFFETLARLRAIVGNDRVGSPVLRDTWRPDAVAIEPPQFEETRIAETAEPPPAIGPVLRRYRPPTPAFVICKENGEPSLLETKELSAGIAQAQGPWHASGEWWDNESWKFEEWDIQTRDGRLFRIARNAEGWKVLGEYD